MKFFTALIHYPVAMHIRSQVSKNLFALTDRERKDIGISVGDIARIADQSAQDYLADKLTGARAATPAKTPGMAGGRA